jgi:hypothetical protein
MASSHPCSSAKSSLAQNDIFAAAYLFACISPFPVSDPCAIRIAFLAMAAGCAVPPIFPATQRTFVRI